jgi:hypothetical protein
MEEIEDVLDDSGPLLYMGSVLSESCEELDIILRIQVDRLMRIVVAFVLTVAQ